MKQKVVRPLLVDGGRTFEERGDEYRWDTGESTCVYVCIFNICIYLLSYLRWGKESLSWWWAEINASWWCYYSITWSECARCWIICSCIAQTRDNRVKWSRLTSPNRHRAHRGRSNWWRTYWWRTYDRWRTHSDRGSCWRWSCYHFITSSGSTYTNRGEIFLPYWRTWIIYLIFKKI